MSAYNIPTEAHIPLEPSWNDFIADRVKVAAAKVLSADELAALEPLHVEAVYDMAAHEIVVQLSTHLWALDGEVEVDVDTYEMPPDIQEVERTTLAGFRSWWAHTLDVLTRNPLTAVGDGIRAWATPTIDRGREEVTVEYSHWTTTKTLHEAKRTVKAMCPHMPEAAQSHHLRFLQQPENETERVQAVRELEYYRGTLSNVIEELRKAGFNVE